MKNKTKTFEHGECIEQVMKFVSENIETDNDGDYDCVLQNKIKITIITK